VAVQQCAGHRGIGGLVMIIAAFVALLAATLGFGAWLGTRLTRASYEIAAALAVEQRGWDVCNAAASAETACDFGGEL
jgi:hypothetical protein